jgi:predicted nucleic acid-binding protein
MNIFVDSDIILDLIAKREPFYIHSAKLFTLIDSRKIKAFTSPLVFANLHYLLKKYRSNSFALQSLRKLKSFLNILPIDSRVVEQALNSEFKDFEDALQNFTAINNGVKVIITRNKSDYKKSKITVSSAEEFVNAWQVQSRK